MPAEPPHAPPDPPTPPASPAAAARTTRLAPSPTGALHLGNARTFLITWAIARREHWRILFRVEDLDTPRVKDGAAEDIAAMLAWLGMDWDAPVVGPRSNPLVQSLDLEPYRAAMRSLARHGLAYPCELSRTEIAAAASAPQEGSHDVAFPAALRPSIAGQSLDFDAVQARSGGGTNWRLVVEPGDIPVSDRFAGLRSFDVSAIVGDFVLWTKRDQPSYQLAVVVDDHRQGVTDVIRGDDLLDSAARQTLLYRGLALGEPPDYRHLPLVKGEDGMRLAKRHGDTRLDRYRAAGVGADRVVGLVAHWSIPGAGRSPMTALEFMRRLDPTTIPRSPATFTAEDDRWLLAPARTH